MANNTLNSEMEDYSGLVVKVRTRSGCYDRHVVFECCYRDEVRRSGYD